MFHDAAPTDWLEPGETAVVNVDGFPIALANVEGEYFAFQHLCPHQGTALGGRTLERGCVMVCPQHSSQYDVRTGECLVASTPDNFAQDLMTFLTRVVDDVVQVDV